MSNAPSTRPRRSFATGSGDSKNSQHVPLSLKYDGEDVPVLIRLPDFSPQALLRETAPPSEAVPTAIVHPSAPVDQSTTPSPDSVIPSPADPAADKPAAQPPVVTEPAATELACQQVATTQVAASETAQPKTDAPDVAAPSASPPGREQSTDKYPKAADSETTPSSSEGSQRKNRRRKRGGRKQHGNQSDKVEVASRQPDQRRREARPNGRRRTESSTVSNRRDEHILAFDKSRWLIGAGLIVVAGVTFFALRGGSEDQPEPAQPWAGSDPSIVKSADPVSAPEADLWPAGQDAGSVEHAGHDETTAAAQSVVASDTPPPAETGPWAAQSQQQTADSFDPNALPVADYASSPPPITAPANVPAPSTPSDSGPVSAWPSESSTPAQPTSITTPVNAWPDAAMAEPAQTVPSGTPAGYYPSQPAGYTTTTATAGPSGYGDASPIGATQQQTETNQEPSISGSTADPGSQLNGTIAIPRPRANNEYNGSSVY